MDSKAELVEKVKSANNILVTVSRNPSVDQLAACIALTLLLNKLNKHATAVFSGQVPSTMEFLQPEQTLEKNTDSLRDFIIALDKSKADKLRYKVEDEMVRIFITPYRTSISQSDLEFSQGDFNVDLVVALGVHQQEDLDEAIISHGRILHDATVSTINTDQNSDLGSINWNDPQASSLSELVADLGRQLGNLLDGQIATALLTGIVAETARFSNDKTTPQTMSVSSELMAAGANQQLVASKLEEPAAPPSNDDHKDSGDGNSTGEGDAIEPPKANDGELDIDHNSQGDPPEAEVVAPVDAPELQLSDQAAAENDLDAMLQLPEPPIDAELPEVSDVKETASETPIVDSAGLFTHDAASPILADEMPAPTADGSVLPSAPKVLTDTEPPILGSGGTLTANTEPEELEPAPDPLSAPGPELPGLLNHDAPHNDAMTTVPDPVGDDSSSPVADLALPEPDATATPPAAPVTTTHSDPDHLLPGFTPPPPAWVPPSDDAFDIVKPHEEPAVTTPPPDETLVDIETSVHSPHLEHEAEAAAASASTARDEVLRAFDSAPPPPEPIQALNAQPMGDSLHPDTAAAMVHPPLFDATAHMAASPVVPGATFEETLPPLQPLPSAPQLNLPVAPDPAAPAAQVIDPTAPPPVPPPLPFQFGAPNQ